MTTAAADVRLLTRLDFQPHKEARTENDSRPLFLGAWLFRQRSWIPLPLVAALLVIPNDDPSPSTLPYVGAVIVIAGEALRLWAVRHIGVISRTRSDRLGPIVRSGPFAFVRNPLYVGNIAIWIGFALVARLAWLVPIFAIILAVEYHLIVGWEEHLLRERRGEDYLAYMKRVPRWIPSAPGLLSSADRHQPSVPGPQSPLFSWGEMLFSERGTLIAMAAGFLVLALKAAGPPS